VVNGPISMLLRDHSKPDADSLVMFCFTLVPFLVGEGTDNRSLSLRPISAPAPGLEWSPGRSLYYFNLSLRFVAHFLDYQTTKAAASVQCVSALRAGVPGYSCLVWAGPRASYHPAPGWFVGPSAIAREFEVLDLAFCFQNEPSRRYTSMDLDSLPIRTYSCREGSRLYAWRIQASSC
jgi:hypothetical protein